MTFLESRIYPYFFYNLYKLLTQLTLLLYWTSNSKQLNTVFPIKKKHGFHLENHGVFLTDILSCEMNISHNGAQNSFNKVSINKAILLDPIFVTSI